MCRLENIQKSHNQRDLDRPREIDAQNLSHKSNFIKTSNLTEVSGSLQHDPKKLHHTINEINTYHTKENL